MNSIPVQLLAMGGAYARLYREQFEGQPERAAGEAPAATGG